MTCRRRWRESADPEPHPGRRRANPRLYCTAGGQMNTEAEKQVAAEYAANLVHDGMVIGLGSGTTAAHLVRALGTRVASGLHFTAVATSEDTEALARSVNIPLSTLDEIAALD